MRPREAAAVAVGAVLVVVGARWSRSAWLRPDVPATGGVRLRSVTDRLWDALSGVASWVGGHLPVAVALVVAVAIAGVVVRVRGHRAGPQDPQRMYEPDQRREVFSRAGNRCEYTGVLLTRCPRPAEHADHLIPWTAGGATSVRNGVASCAHHNTSKGARFLPAWRVRLLVRRRRAYFPAGTDVAAGERYEQALASGTAHR